MDRRSKDIILRNKINFDRIDLHKLKPFIIQEEIFSPAMLTDIFDARECDLFTELLTRGPNAVEKLIRALCNAGYNEEAQILNPVKISTIPTRMCYKIISKPLGFCKIINNVKFRELRYRHGSDVDAESLHFLFKKIGYEVSLEHNLTRYEMLLKIEEFSELDWSSVDSCVLIILSHGDTFDNRDMVYGVDDLSIDKIDMYEMFDNHNCKHLQDKPKIFLFITCRGKREDKGVTESTDAAVAFKRPIMSDMLVVHASLPNHVSYRDHVRGTWFCQDFVNVLSSDYMKDSLETMLQKVDRKMGMRLSKDNMKQTTHVDKYGLKADIYFCLNHLNETPEFYKPLNC